MLNVTVQTANAYDVRIGRGLIARAGAEIASVFSPCRMAIITDTTVNALYGNIVEKSLADAGFATLRYAFPAGEQHKRLSTLEGILEQCEAAGKRFYMEINSGWYQPSFFFGAGCTLAYDVDDNGNPVSCRVDYASEQGVHALKAMIDLSGSSAFVNGSSASNASGYAAIVDGVWDSGVIREAFGENYAAARLPSFTVDGSTYQMGGFGGFKLIGIKPQTDTDKLAACDALASFLTSGEVQEARCEASGWGPSNLEARQSEAVRNNAALSALADQLRYCVVQGQYPGEYWNLAAALGDSVMPAPTTIIPTNS